MQTRILVTHGLTYLQHVDQIVVLHQGKIFESGSYDDLINKDGAFAHYIRTYLTEEDLSETESDAEGILETIVSYIHKKWSFSIFKRNSGSLHTSNNNIIIQYLYSAYIFLNFECMLKI